MVSREVSWRSAKTLYRWRGMSGIRAPGAMVIAPSSPGPSPLFELLLSPLTSSGLAKVASSSGVAVSEQRAAPDAGAQFSLAAPAGLVRPKLRK
jgi:hypothetical protein